MAVPKVSVVMITYGHEAYIQQAIDGVLMQQCNFEIELIIANDRSPDNTDAVVKDIILNHPKGHSIKYFLHEQNKGMMQNFFFAMDQAQGTYIALCEGDDFWKDPLKLQKQADFLTNHEDYGLVHTDCDFLYSNGKTSLSVNKASKLNLQSRESNDALFDALINGEYKIRTATVVIRKSLYDSVADDIKQSNKFLMGDTPMWLIFSQKTKFHYIDEVTTVYRISENSASRPQTIEKERRFQLEIFEMRIFFLNKYNKPIGDQIKKRYNKALINYKFYNPQYAEKHQPYSPSFFQSMVYKNIDNGFGKTLWKLRKIKDKLIKLTK